MNKKGFTLIELLVVVSLIAIIAAVLLDFVTSAQRNSKNAQRTSDIHRVQGGLEQYYADHGYYPCSQPYVDDGTCDAKTGFNNNPAAPGHILSDCTGNPDKVNCKEDIVYLDWKFQDPIYLNDGGSGHNYCYTPFISSTNLHKCNNTTQKCQYYEMGVSMQLTNPEYYPYRLSGLACNGGNHSENYVLTSQGVLTLPSSPGTISRSP